MTLLEFTAMRKRELLEFCKARFGRRWRRTVAHQLGIHPRTFQRWKSGKASSVPQHLHRFESWARSIGFNSPADADIHAALREHRRFKRAAAREQARAKSNTERKSRALTLAELERHPLFAALYDALKNPKPDQHMV